MTIDTAKFLSDGLEFVASRMSYIFERLKALDKTIILFDEIEEFCLDRENPSLSMESRLLTTAMLTQLNDLRRQQSSVFIVATNRLRSFDAAVIRPGRFDMILFVGTPNVSSRVKRLDEKLKKTSIGADKSAAAVEVFERVMTKKWKEFRFLTFAENESLINFVADTLVKGGDVTEDSLMKQAGNILKTGTIQGQVREEYIVSETLSRV